MINGASDLLGEVFGEAGAHARSAVGVAELPLDAPVEVELVVEVGWMSPGGRDGELSAGHELLLRLAGRLPGDLLWRLRDWLAAGAHDLARRAARRASCCAAASGSPTTSASCWSPAAGDWGAKPRLLDAVLPLPAPDDTGRRVRARQRPCSTLAALSAALGRRPEPPGHRGAAPGLAARAAGSGCCSCSAASAPWLLTGTLQRMLRAHGDRTPCVEVVPTGTELPGYHRGRLHRIGPAVGRPGAPGLRRPRSRPGRHPRDRDPLGRVDRDLTRRSRRRRHPCPRPRPHRTSCCCTWPGRVDDDLLATGRELVAVGEDVPALELLVASLAAGRRRCPSPSAPGWSRPPSAARVEPDADRALAPGVAPADSAHRFAADGGPDEAAVGSPGSGQAAGRTRGRARVSLTWRQTPAGAAPGPLPQPVLLVAMDDPRPAEVLAYQLGTTLGRAGVPASVEAFVDGSALPPYQQAALAEARPLDPAEGAGGREDRVAAVTGPPVALRANGLVPPATPRPRPDGADLAEFAHHPAPTAPSMVPGESGSRSHHPAPAAPETDAGGQESGSRHALRTAAGAGALAASAQTVAWASAPDDTSGAVAEGVAPATGDTAVTPARPPSPTPVPDVSRPEDPATATPGAGALSVGTRPDETPDTGTTAAEAISGDASVPTGAPAGSEHTTVTSEADAPPSDPDAPVATDPTSGADAAGPADASTEVDGESIAEISGLPTEPADDDSGGSPSDLDPGPTTPRTAGSSSGAGTDPGTDTGTADHSVSPSDPDGGTEPTDGGSPAGGLASGSPVSGDGLMTTSAATSGPVDAAVSGGAPAVQDGDAGPDVVDAGQDGDAAPDVHGPAAFAGVTGPEGSRPTPASTGSSADAGTATPPNGASSVPAGATPPQGSPSVPTRTPAHGSSAVPETAAPSNGSPSGPAPGAGPFDDGARPDPEPVTPSREFPATVLPEGNGRVLPFTGAPRPGRADASSAEHPAPRPAPRRIAPVPEDPEWFTPPPRPDDATPTTGPIPTTGTADDGDALDGPLERPLLDPLLDPTDGAAGTGTPLGAAAASTDLGTGPAASGPGTGPTSTDLGTGPAASGPGSGPAAFAPATGPAASAPATGPATSAPPEPGRPAARPYPVADHDAPPEQDAWDRDWATGDWSVPGAGAGVEPATHPTPSTGLGTDDDAGPDTPSRPALRAVSGPPPILRAPAPPGSAPRGSGPEATNPALPAGPQSVPDPEESRPRHRLATPDAEPGSEHESHAAVPQAPESGAPAAQAPATGVSAPQASEQPPRPSPRPSRRRERPSSGTDLGGRLTPNEQDLLRRLQQELAAREDGPSDPGPRNGSHSGPGGTGCRLSGRTWCGGPLGPVQPVATSSTRAMTSWRCSARAAPTGRSVRPSAIADARSSSSRP